MDFHFAVRGRLGGRQPGLAGGRAGGACRRQGGDTLLQRPLQPPPPPVLVQAVTPPPSPHPPHPPPTPPTPPQVSDGGVASVLQLLHLFLEQPRWEAAAMERSKQQYLSHYRSLSKSLERATADRILQVGGGGERGGCPGQCRPQVERERESPGGTCHFTARVGGRAGERAGCARVNISCGLLIGGPSAGWLLQAMLGPDRRFRDPNPEEIAALDLEGMRSAVMRQIHAGNVEVRAGGGTCGATA